MARPLSLTILERHLKHSFGHSRDGAIQTNVDYVKWRENKPFKIDIHREGERER